MKTLSFFSKAEYLNRKKCGGNWNICHSQWRDLLGWGPFLTQLKHTQHGIPLSQAAHDAIAKYLTLCNV